jgi:hypothetical protein
MQEIYQPELVEKESISQFTFKNETHFKVDSQLQKKLENATGMGNLEKVKFQIDFLADSGPKSVQTTIWATGSQFICLKGGLWIPISKIIDIKYI